MVKRIYFETVKKWAKGLGITGGTLIGLIFMYLFAVGAISNVSFSGDTICAGTIEDPCYAYINFTANEDIFIYPTDYDPWGRDTLFSFDPNVKSWKLERSWGNYWWEYNLSEPCTSPRCGARQTGEPTYSLAWRKGKDYQIRITAYKNNPTDDIKWGAFSGVDNIDPVWYGIENVFLPTLNEYGEIKYGKNYDDIPIGNGQRQFISYGLETDFPRNVNYNGKKYRIEKSPSLMEEFDGQFLVNGDGINFIRIVDFNLTNVYMCLKSGNIGNVPLRVFKENKEFDKKTNEFIIKKKYIYETNINILSKNTEQCFWINQNLLEVTLEFGENSTEINIISTTADGRIIRDAGEAWDDCHGSGTGTSLSSTLSFNTVQADHPSTQCIITRSFTYHDTSSIPDGSIIDSVSLNMYGWIVEGGNVSVQEGTQAASLTTADYDSCNPSPASGGGEYGHTVGFALSQWNVVEFNELGKSKINDVGETKLCLRHYNNDYLDSEPSGSTSGAGWYSAEGAQDKIFLNVTYSELTDTCTYSSGDWEVVCSDNCSIVDNVNLGGNNLSFTGTGVFNIQANITNFDKIFKPNGCQINIKLGDGSLSK